MPDYRNDLFGRSAMPPTFDREGRVRLIAEVAAALLRGELPDAPARLFVAGALSAWLREGGRGGSLEHDYLKTTAPRRSTLTAPRLWQRQGSTRRTTTVEEGRTMQPSTHEVGDSHD